jgi:hypothetical protein
MAAGRQAQGGGMERRTDGGGGDQAAFGFLTAVESPTHGTFGGYLLVDELGRPIEFHCTAPVKVSRAQAILYGPTLHGHLHGRQIGGALLAAGTLAPVVVLTDQEPLLQARAESSLPVALVRRADSEPGPAGLTLGELEVRPAAGPLDDAVRERLTALAVAVDLREPFERIRAAIDEAQRH